MTFLNKNVATQKNTFYVKDFESSKKLVDDISPSKL